MASLNYQIIDNYADMLNYEKPFTKYFYEITSALKNEVFIVNHLNFNPAIMSTHKGFFFDQKVEEPSYFFIQNEKHTIDKSQLLEGQTTNGCLIAIYLWMQNTLQHYERNYDKFQDLLSDIGGISSIVITIGYYVNLLVHNYIIVLDTQDLVLNRHHYNYKGRSLGKKPTIIRQANQIMLFRKNRKKKSYIDIIKKQSSSKSQRFMKYDLEKMQNIIKKGEKSDNNNTNIYLNKKSLFKTQNNNKDITIRNRERNNSTIFFKRRLNNYNYMSRNINNKDNISENKKILDLFSKDDLIKDNDEDLENRPIEKQEFNWFKYIWYLICCGTNDKKISYYEDFRSKLISEENIIQNYLDIYKLLKENNLQKINI